MSRKPVLSAVLGVLLILVILAVLCYRDTLFQKQLTGEGRLEVRGWAKDMFYVYAEADGERKDFTYTGKTLTLPAGKYRIELNGSSEQVTLRGDAHEVLESGLIFVEGTGLNLFEVWDQAGENKLNFTGTGKGLELFPGSYIIKLNSMQQPTVVLAGDTTRVRTGLITVSGAFSGLYAVYDETGMAKLNFTSCGKALEMLPGIYLVQWEGGESQVEVEAGELAVADEIKDE